MTGRGPSSPPRATSLASVQGSHSLAFSSTHSFSGYSLYPLPANTSLVPQSQTFLLCNQTLTLLKASVHSQHGCAFSSPPSISFHDYLSPTSFL
jgi:hypothetical protein